MSTKGEKTRKAIDMALYRIENGRTRTIDASRKLSVAAVAEEAGVSTATIHNRHPEIAEKVRRLLDKETRQQRDRKHQSLLAEKAKSRELRKTLKERNEEIAKLFSINAALQVENAELRAIAEADNVSVFRK